MAKLISDGSKERNITPDEQREFVAELLKGYGDKLQRVLLVPPDHTRFYSGAGLLTNICYELLSPTAQVDIMPALGTHSAMTEAQLHMMFGDKIPLDRYLVHDWRNALVHLGDVPGELITEWSEGKLDYSVRVEINRVLLEGNYDLILSIGQVVPHEVVGMANYTKNICVGVGGADLINKSHFLGAVYGSERLMGRSESPVRKVFNYACETFMKDLPIQYLLTVMEQAEGSEDMYMRGLFIGDDVETFEDACKLSQEVNINFVEERQKKVVVYLPPHEFKSTWLGNKSVYRTRMMIADGGELIVMGPGLKEFGEDAGIDKLIREFGYIGTDHTLASVQESEGLAASLSAAAHLIHGTSDSRFTVTYCPGGGLTKEEIEQVGYNYGDLDEMMSRYPIEQFNDGPNTLADGEEIYYISNPALGLWAVRDEF